jgi:hypothetical protein
LAPGTKTDAPKLAAVDVGAVLALLASDAATLLTGANIALDAGTTAGGSLSALLEIVSSQLGT